MTAPRPETAALSPAAAPVPNVTDAKRLGTSPRLAPRLREPQLRSPVVPLEEQEEVRRLRLGGSSCCVICLIPISDRLSFFTATLAEV